MTEITIVLVQDETYKSEKIKINDPALLTTPEYLYTEIMLATEKMLKEVKSQKITLPLDVPL